MWKHKCICMCHRAFKNRCITVLVAWIWYPSPVSTNVTTESLSSFSTFLLSIKSEDRSKVFLPLYMWKFNQCWITATLDNSVSIWFWSQEFTQHSIGVDDCVKHDRCNSQTRLLIIRDWYLYYGSLKGAEYSDMRKFIIIFEIIWECNIVT